ncbi:leishmanolysin-like peptidase isoform X2 [Liolophura sinensis]
MDRQVSQTPYCVLSCVANTMCGEVIIPQEHLEACYTCSGSVLCEKKGITGPGVHNTDFILYISAVQSDRCHLGSTVAYAAHCQLEHALDRPVAGYINICPGTLSTTAHDLHQTISTVKHEILHALGFTAGLYAFYRDPLGNPLTPRRGPTNKPIFNETMGVHMWSEKVVKAITRPMWMVASGNIPKQVHLLVTPRVVEETRRHFNCSTLEGAELEDQGILGTTLTHWEKRVFENEAMTGTYTQNPVFSRITLALMEDTGWYRVNYDNAEELLWGKNLGCDFVKKSCMEWMVRRKEMKESLHPYCDNPKEGLLLTECSMNRESVALCNLVEYPPSRPIPRQFQYFRDIPSIPGSDPRDFGGSVFLADYCPFIQDFTWKSGDMALRTSKCTDPANNIEPKLNYLLEKYGAKSACFNHAGFFVLKHCHESTSPQHGGSGCYQYTCRNGTGLSLQVASRSYLCSYMGQKVKVFGTSKSWLHQGEIICPSCAELCSKHDVVCPAESEQSAHPTSPLVLPDAPCFGTIGQASQHSSFVIWMVIIPNLLSFLTGLLMTW